MSGRGQVHWLYDVSLVCCVARVCCFVTLAEDVCHRCCGGSGSCGCLQRHVRAGRTAALRPTEGDGRPLGGKDQS